MADDVKVAETCNKAKSNGQAATHLVCQNSVEYFTPKKDFCPDGNTSHCCIESAESPKFNQASCTKPDGHL
ncbi:hypothetical protein PGT21_011004 [Puccinia graminis f. sp. tritici]|uniref:Uncharacterized protein n=1 Tax=Puccinia graminis f. sp. tritici TaxID=56615 RepID=A0A5B0LUW0_PUCGR|nr:hypothetical protein PGT21_011004 [Puccinia graminis f. sp. tritici]KAA1092156.1 hypothetical protein PGTUg99_009759 [Puccinia graminis f. sp. tritici]